MPRLRTVFLTGASSGIGLATAQALSAAGYEVWGTSRDPGRLPALPHLHPVRLDLNDAESLRAGFGQAQEESGGIGVLINNAGDVINGPLEALVADGLRAQLETLFFGPMELIRLALPGMRKRRDGLIVNVTSLAARFPIPFNAGYNAGKAALASATECVRLELSGTGIRVVDVQPGDIATDIQRRTRLLASPECAAYEPNLSQSRRVEDDKALHAPRPERVASLIVRLLASPAPPPVTTVGTFFEARLAPVLARLVPRRMLEWGVRRMYGLKG